jgi:hypothetical protein
MHSLEENMQMRDLLSSYMNNNDVTAMYFYDAVNQRIITTDAVFSNAADYFKYKYLVEKYTVEESLNRLDELTWGYKYRSNISINLDGKSMQVIEYVISVPINRIKNSQPHLIMIMETEDIFGDFYDILEDDSEFHIYNNDQLIFSSDEQYKDIAGSMELSGLTEVEPGEDNIYYMAGRSDDKLWRYEVYMPNLLRSVNTDTMPNYVWLLISVPVIVSIVFCIYFKFRNHRELQKILKLFREHDDRDVEEVALGAIREYAYRIMDDNKRIRERIHTYDSRYKYEVLDKILRNTYANKEEMEQALKDTDLYIKDESGWYYVFIMKIPVTGLLLQRILR